MHIGCAGAGGAVSGLGTAAVALVMAVGLAGTLVPFLPGLALIWAAGLVFGLVAGFGTGGAVAFGVMTVLLAAGTAAHYLLPTRCGAARGAAPRALAAGAALGMVGFFVVPVVGLPLGAALGVLLAERSRTGDWAAAWDRTRGVVLGFGLGVLAELAAGLLMVLTWAAWAASAS